MDKVLFSKGNDDWSTPDWLYNSFMKKGFVDPCPLKCEDDNLGKDFGNVNLFINPPYSDIMTWVDFALNHITKHPDNVVTLLVPSRTDTKWFHKLVNGDYSVSLWFIKGRLHFGKSNNSAPFPSVLININKFTFKNRFFGTVRKEDFIDE